MSNFKIVVEVRDKREEYIIEWLLSQNYDAVKMTEGNWAAADKDKKYVFAFAMATSLTAYSAEGLPPGCTVFSRAPDNSVLSLLKKKNINHIEYMDDQSFVVKNAYLTAEGALAYLISNTEGALRDTPVLILGYGRVGKSLLKVLKDNYAVTAVATNDRLEFALASAFADGVYTLDDCFSQIGSYGAIINSVPKKLLKGEILRSLDKSCFILDLASKPGGLDTDALDNLGIRYIHALGVPGKLMPKTAGKYLGESIVKRLKNL